MNAYAFDSTGELDLDCTRDSFGVMSLSLELTAEKLTFSAFLDGVVITESCGAEWCL